MSDYTPPDAEPVDHGPIDVPRRAEEPQPIDEFLGRLYGPPEKPTSLIQAQPARQSPRAFPPVMWWWAAGTASLALLAILLFLI
ncbi:hypothetical protein EJO69_07940 [Flaviflexus salsibiostraticola]|uniref:Uncharacterized protein n=1 Tax=Flaviflexus salsibiostraticola TaxID=1282737 RepID=A0A3S8Z9U0_9ACTO|nr:hypothetical protein [Flaviflexus salsibiostraticola]AZN30242.1 hypothetical protein EJO69_07940 [Flaviflexus salsibiostraticola]